MEQILDVIVEPRYDSGTIPAAGILQLTFFALPLGQGVTNWGGAGTKTLRDTNMDLASQLPAGFNFVLLGFRIQPLFNITQADSVLALQTAVFTFTIGQKDYLRVPAATIPQGNGPAGFFTQAVAANATALSNGWPILANSYSIAKKPLELLQTQNFRATLTWQAAVAVTSVLAGQAAAGLPLTIYLDGFLKRIVQ